MNPSSFYARHPNNGSHQPATAPLPAIYHRSIILQRGHYLAVSIQRLYYRQHPGRLSLASPAPAGRQASFTVHEGHSISLAMLATITEEQRRYHRCGGTRQRTSRTEKLREVPVITQKNAPVLWPPANPGLMFPLLCIKFDSLSPTSRLPYRFTKKYNRCKHPKEQLVQQINSH